MKPDARVTENGVDRAAWALWLLLVALTLARAALAFEPSMWAWGLNLMRFVPPAPAWLLWAVAAIFLVPPIARRVERGWAAARIGAGAGWGSYAPWVAGAAALALLLPDRGFFAGDFTLREISIQAERSTFGALYPQALPLDRFLHDTAVRVLLALGLDSNGAGRLLGAMEAAVLGGLAFHASRVLDLRGAAALAASSVIFWGGHLALFTGYNKAFAELVLVTVAVAVFGVEAVRSGRGLLRMGMVLGLGLLLHRLALGLVPAAAVAWVLWARRHGRGGAWRRPAALASAALPLATLAVMAPRLARLVTGFDTDNFLSAEVRRQGGVLAAALTRTHVTDFANLTAMLSPLAPAILLAPLATRGALRRRELAVLPALVAPLVAFAPFYHPPQGLFRDWDGFATTGVAVSVAAGAVVGEILRARRRFAWLGVAVSLAVAAPAAQWLLHNASADRVIDRVEAYARESPARRDFERATAWDYLGMRRFGLGRIHESAASFARAAEIAPSPRILREWAVSESARGNREAARRIYRRLLARQPDHAAAWLELAFLSVEVGDHAEARRAAEQVLRLEPGAPAAVRILESLSQRPPSP